MVERVVRKVGKPLTNWELEDTGGKVDMESISHRVIEETLFLGEIKTQKK